MGFIEKRGDRYRARYRDPCGQLTSRSFTRKADAQRFVREMEVKRERGAWIDPARRSLDTDTVLWGYDVAEQPSLHVAPGVRPVGTDDSERSAWCDHRRRSRPARRRHRAPGTAHPDLVLSH